MHIVAPDIGFSGHHLVIDTVAVTPGEFAPALTAYPGKQLSITGVARPFSIVAVPADQLSAIHPCFRVAHQAEVVIQPIAQMETQARAAIKQVALIRTAIFTAHHIIDTHTDIAADA